MGRIKTLGKIKGKRRQVVLKTNCKVTKDGADATSSQGSVALLRGDGHTPISDRRLTHDNSHEESAPDNHNRNRSQIFGLDRPRRSA